MFLSDDEIKDLTGYTWPRLQVRWLDQRGWKYEQNCAGRPKVLRSYAERQLGNEPTNGDSWDMDESKIA